MERTWMPTVAGILNIAAAASSFIGSFWLAVLAGFGRCFSPDGSWGVGPNTPFFYPSAVFGVLAAFLFVLTILALIGSVQILRRGGWAWALIGSIAAVFAFFPLGIPAVILTVMSEKEIRQKS